MGQRVATVCVMALAAATGMPARAALDYTIEAGVGHSDNIARVPTGEIDETIATAGLDLSWTARRPRLDGEANVNLNYFDYLDDTFSSEFVGTADGTAVFGLVPGRFTWLVQDSFGQVRGDPFAPVSPENRENINYFTTGPDLIANLGATARGRVFGRYSVSSFETSPLDGERMLGGLALSKQLSSSSEIGINAVTEAVKFDDEFNTDQDRDSLFVNYSLAGARSDVQVEAGYTWLEFENGNKTDGLLLRVSANRRLSSASSVYLTFGSQLTDAADALRASMGGATPGGAAAISATSDPFEKRSVSAGWNFHRNRTSLDIGGSWDRDEFETQSQLDRTSLVWNASLQRTVSPKLTVGLLASLTNEDFDTTDQNADELRYGLTVDWRFARTLGLRLLAERFDRDSDAGLGEFVENRAFLTLIYQPRRTTQ